MTTGKQSTEYDDESCADDGAQVIAGPDITAIPLADAITYLIEVGGIDELEARALVLMERGEWRGDRKAVE